MQRLTGPSTRKTTKMTSLEGSNAETDWSKHTQDNQDDKSGGV